MSHVRGNQRLIRDQLADRIPVSRTWRSPAVVMISNGIEGWALNPGAGAAVAACPFCSTLAISRQPQVVPCVLTARAPVVSHLTKDLVPTVDRDSARTSSHGSARWEWPIALRTSSQHAMPADVERAPDSDRRRGSTAARSQPHRHVGNTPNLAIPPDATTLGESAAVRRSPREDNGLAVSAGSVPAPAEGIELADDGPARGDRSADR